jgi:hypothetical protein
MSREAGTFSDPANPQAAPGYGVVVGVALPVDLGDAKGDGFVVEHCSRTLVTRLTYVAWHITEIANLSDLRCGNLTGLASPGFVGLRGRLTRPHSVALRPCTDLTGNADWTHIRTMMAQRLLCSTSASVEGFGCRPRRIVPRGQWPASESRQRTNPRVMCAEGAARSAMGIRVTRTVGARMAMRSREEQWRTWWEAEGDVDG